MPNSEPSIPRACSEAFANIQRTLGEIKATGEATHDQATKTNGHVSSLYDITGTHAVAIGKLITAQDDFTRRMGQYDSTLLRALGYGWRAALVLAGIVATLLGVKNLLS